MPATARSWRRRRTDADQEVSPTFGTEGRSREVPTLGRARDPEQRAGDRRSSASVQAAGTTICCMLAALLAQTSASDSITGVAGWMTGLIDSLGPLGVGVIIVAETVFPPIPSEVVLPAAGYLAGLGQLGFWATLVFATLGSVIGSLVLYGAGRWVGTERLTRVAAKVPLMSERDVERAWAAFERWDQKAIFWGRLVPGVRSLVSIPAGAKQMAIGPFVALTAGGSLIWNAALLGAGWFLGDRFGATASVSHWMNIAVLAAAAGLVGWFLVSKFRHRNDVVGPGTIDADSSAVCSR